MTKLFIIYTGWCDMCLWCCTCWMTKLFIIYTGWCDMCLWCCTCWMTKLFIIYSRWCDQWHGSWCCTCWMIKLFIIYTGWCDMCLWCCTCWIIKLFNIYTGRCQICIWCCTCLMTKLFIIYVLQIMLIIQSATVTVKASQVSGRKIVAIGVFPKCFSLNSVNSLNSVTKNYDIKRTRTCHPATSGARDKHATTAPVRHMWEIGSLNWAQFMLQFLWIHWIQRKFCSI